MKFVDEDIKNFENYIEITTLNKFGIKILNTKKNYGDILKKSREEIAKDLKLENKILISGHQTHSDNVVLIENADKTYFENTDGFITKNKNFAILTKYADCLPIFIYDEESKIFGAVHSGWKGSYQKIVIKAIEKMKLKSLSNINIVFGIGISCEKYEVGKDFYDNFLEKFSKEIVEKSFEIREGKYYFNNQYFNYYLLKEYGLDEDKIFLNNRCTFQEDFHSYRRDREESGRNGAVIFMDC